MRQLSRRDFVLKTATAGLMLGLRTRGASAPPPEAAPGRRIGIIGLDGSHAGLFTKAINNPAAGAEYGNYRVVAAYPHGSLDIQSSVSRVPAYTEEMRKMGIAITGSIEELVDRVDAVFMVTNDGRRHLEQALPVFKAGKRMYIDKPMAASLRDAMAIFEAAESYKVPVYSCSNARFAKATQEVVNGKIGKVIGADVYGPSPIERTHPTLFWYGIHGVESLCTVMGTGCQSVTRVFNEDTDISVGVWPGKRLGVVRAMRTGRRGNGGTAYGEKGIARLEEEKEEKSPKANPAYQRMTDFFRTGIAPVTSAETLEVLAFMEAAEVSMQSGGKRVELETVLQRARSSRPNTPRRG